MSDKESVSENAVPVQELKTPAFVSVRRFIRSVLVVLMSFVCILVGVLIYQLHAPLEDLHMTEKPVYDGRHIGTVAVPAVQPDIKSNATNGVARLRVAGPAVQPDIKSTGAVKTDPIQETEPAQDENIALPPKQTETPKQIAVFTEPEPEPALPDVPALTLGEALRLRDHLDDGVSCTGDLQRILKTRLVLADEALKEELIERLIPVCTGDDIMLREMNRVFVREKKQALMTYYKMNNPRWLAYLKAIGSAVVDIRRVHPVKQKPKDIVSLAQNALNMHDVAQAVAQVRKLPPAMQDEFRTFVALAETYTAAERAAEDLILSFERKGKKDD